MLRYGLPAASSAKSHLPLPVLFSIRAPMMSAYASLSAPESPR